MYNVFYRTIIGISLRQARGLPHFKVFALLILTVAAAIAVPPPQPSPKPAAAAKPSSDAELEQAIRERFAKSKISVNQFTVKVQGGVATIEGRTGIIQHKGTATRLAKAAGAKRVVNNVKISEAAREKASANLTKGRRRAQVKRTETTKRSER